MTGAGLYANPPPLPPILPTSLPPSYHRRAINHLTTLFARVALSELRELQQVPNDRAHLRDISGRHVRAYRRLRPRPCGPEHHRHQRRVQCGWPEPVDYRYRRNVSWIGVGAYAKKAVCASILYCSIFPYVRCCAALVTSSPSPRIKEGVTTYNPDDLKHGRC